jgi:polyisoprenoid-binding protein YceI
MMRGFPAVVAFVLAVVPALAGDIYVADAARSEARFEVRQFLSTISGRFKDIRGTINLDPENLLASSVDFSMKTASLDTDSAERDQLLRSPDVFDAERYPLITFKSTSVKPTALSNVYNVTGDFSLHGVKKRITLPVEFKGFAKDAEGDVRAGFTVKTTLNRKDYGINWNKVLDHGGLLIGDDVDVTVNLVGSKTRR